MEVKGGRRNFVWVILYEFIGTLLLAASINYSSMLIKAEDGGAYAPPITLFCIIMMIGPVSGGHVNPAVTTAVFTWKGELGNAGFAVLIMLT